jgi:hypothetical protein
MRKRIIYFVAISFTTISLSSCSRNYTACECKSVIESDLINGSVDFDDQRVLDWCFANSPGREGYSYYKRECDKEK